MKKSKSAKKTVSNMEANTKLRRGILAWLQRKVELLSTKIVVSDLTDYSSTHITQWEGQVVLFYDEEYLSTKFLSQVKEAFDADDICFSPKIFAPPLSEDAEVLGWNIRLTTPQRPIL